MKRLWVAAALACGLAVAGCGGGGKAGALPEGSSVAPASSIAFISANTDFTSDQWHKIADLASRFPGTQRLIAELEKQTKGLDFQDDVKPALGPEVDLVWLDGANGGNDVVGLTKPESMDKLDALLAKAKPGGSKLFAEQVGDWAVVADSRAKIAKFKEASSGDKLDGDKDFKAAFEKLDSDSSARAWIKGQFVQSALDSGLASGGAPPRLTRDVGNLMQSPRRPRRSRTARASS
jgi:hypothetical protein